MAANHKKIYRIRTGGQSGVDRAAMDFAREYGIPLCGWCPKNGWAEDYPVMRMRSSRSSRGVLFRHRAQT